MSALALYQATVRRDGRTVLDGATLSVAPGELVGVVGANGAGKTTLLRAALGLRAWRAVVLSSGAATSPPCPIRNAPAWPPICRRNATSAGI